MKARAACAWVVCAASVAAGGVPACTCDKPPAGDTTDATVAVDGASDGGAPAEAAGLSAPIAAVRLESGDVVVAGIDVPAKAIRVQRVGEGDRVLAERTVFEGAAWSPDADLKLSPAGAGVAATWRGRRSGKLVRQMIVLGSDLAPIRDAVDVAPAWCTTEDAFFSTDGNTVTVRPWDGGAHRLDIVRDKDAQLVCGARAAFAVLDDDDGTSLLTYRARDRRRDGGAAALDASVLLTESAFGEDDQRDRYEYTVGDDLGVVRLASSGALAIREVRDGGVGPLRRAKTTIPDEDDLVAVDATPRELVVVYTEDVSDAGDGGDGAEGCDGGSSTKVLALRIDRATEAESTKVLAEGACGPELGPFFTGAVADGALSVAWVERVPVHGQSRAPVSGLAHTVVPPSGEPAPVARVVAPADALVDAGCDGTRCYAVALTRNARDDAGMLPGAARVLRY